MYIFGGILVESMAKTKVMRWHEMGAQKKKKKEEHWGLRGWMNRRQYLRGIV